MSRMTDLISRQAAIEAMADDIRFSALMDNVEASEDIEDYKPIAEHALRNVPTIQPKKGKWIRIVKHHKDAEQEYSYNEIHCSECGVERKIGWRDARFCPNCGAEMRSYEDAE